MKKGLFFLLFMVAFVFKGFSQSTPADSTEMYAYIDSVLAEARGPIKRTDFFNLMTTFNSYMALQGVNGIGLINASDTASMLTPYINRSDTAAMLATYTRYNEFLDSISDLRTNLQLDVLQLTDTAAMLQSYIQRGDTASMLNSYINRNDTATAFAPFIERSDTATMLTAYISRNDTASMLNSYTRRAELEDTALAIRNDLTAVIGTKTDTTEFNALELTYNPNSQPILNKHYRAVDKQTIYIEEINNAAQGVSRLLNTTLSSGRNAYQDAEVVWIADNSDSAVTYSNKGANFTLSRNGKIYGKNNEGDWFEWSSYYPNIDFQENKQKAGLRLFSYIDYGYYRSRVEADTATLYSIDTCTQNKIEYNVSNSSITLIPDGAKAGSLYSIFPNDGSGDFSVTRATTATRVNASGLIESVAANVPRIDYTGGGCPSLLLEPQRTNIVTHSEDFTTTWTLGGTIITANQTISPRGDTTGSLIQGNGTTSIAYARITGITLPAGVNTQSFYVKYINTQWVRLTFEQFDNSGVVYLDILNGAVGSSTGGVTGSIEDAGNGWFRISATLDIGTTDLTGRAPFFSLVDADGSPVFPNTTAQAQAKAYIWGAQLEAGAYATSYIPTSGTTVTRNADVINLTGAAALLGDSEGTLFWEASIFDADGNGGSLSLSDGTLNNWVRIGKNNVTTAVAFFIGEGGNIQLNASGGTWSDNTFLKAALGYATNDFTGWVNGVQVVTDTSGSTFSSGTLTRVDFSSSGITAPFYGRIRQLAVFPTRLTNAELQTLTQ